MRNYLAIAAVLLLLCFAYMGDFFPIGGVDFEIDSTKAFRFYSKTKDKQINIYDSTEIRRLEQFLNDHSKRRVFGGEKVDNSNKYKCLFYSLDGNMQYFDLGMTTAGDWVVTFHTGTFNLDYKPEGMRTVKRFYNREFGDFVDSVFYHHSLDSSTSIGSN